jgi:hypothetical protein
MREIVNTSRDALSRHEVGAINTCLHVRTMNFVTHLTRGVYQKRFTLSEMKLTHRNTQVNSIVSRERERQHSEYVISMIR